MSTSSQAQTSFLESKEGKKIFCKHWLSEDKPKAIIFLCHGLAEHCLWYEDLAEALVGIGLYVISHDHIGHGQSEGDRNHVDSFEEYTSVVFQHCDDVKSKFPSLPIFIFGHSMGGAITLLAALEKPSYFKGVITSAPALIAAPEMKSPCKVFFGKIIAHLVPQLVMAHIDSKAISRDPAMVKKYEDDPLINPVIKAKWGVSWLNCTEKIEAGLKSIEWPFLALHGDRDELADVKGSQMYHDNAVSHDKTLKIYKGFYHALLIEPEEYKTEVLKDILEWLKERI